MNSSSPAVTPAAPALAEPGAVAIGARIGHLLLDEALAEGPSVLSYDELVEQVEEWDRLASRVDAVRLRLVAEVDRRRVAESAGFAGADSWLAKRTHRDHATTAAGLKLARAVTGSAGATGAALDRGTITPDHARVIVDATAQLPGRVTPDQRSAVEAALVAQAEETNPKTLRRLARRALEAVEADRAAVDAHEDALMRDEERSARARARLTLHDNDDGTTSGHFTVPTLQASMLRKILDSMTAPRRSRLGASEAQSGPAPERRDWAHARGVAFLELLEHLPTDHLHGKVPATIVVTVQHDKLVERLDAAGGAVDRRRRQPVRERGATPGLWRGDPASDPRRRVAPVGPRPHQAALLRSPTGGSRHPAPSLRRRRLRTTLRLVRAAPRKTLRRRGADGSGQRGPGLQLPPSTAARSGL